MSVVRRLAAGVGLALAAGAAAGAGAGLVGAVWGWADAFNHFAPIWLVAAWLGAAGARLGFARGRLRTAALLMAAIAVIASATPMAFEAFRTGRETAQPANLTLLTFNRWWDSPDPEKQIAMIRRSGADLVALQEADTFKPWAGRLRDVYPHQLFCYWECDTVILSKQPFLAHGQESKPRWPGGTKFLWARTTAPDGRPVTLATLHLFWPVPPWIQRGQRGHLPALIAPLAQDELILAGDFNLTPWSFAMRRLDPTLAPLTRRTHGLITFPANQPVPFLALDQVYAAPAWKTVKVERLPDAASDHYPVRVELRR